jgi:endoglucanase Acf2
MSVLAFVVLIATFSKSSADEPIVRQGAGSYTTSLPPGAKAPPQTINCTEAVTGKMPTNKWWSSLAWMKFSERHYPHPLAVEAEANGLRVFYPGANITANKSGIFGFMPAKTGDDLILGHSAQDEFSSAPVDGFSDWFVSVRFAADKNRMRTTYGHGSPFVFALYEGGNPKLTFPKAPQVWSGDERSAVLGVTINGKHFGLFGPGGSSWTGLDSKTFINNLNGKDYFAVAILPDNSEKTLALFKKYAYAHVTDTRVEWAYDPKAGTVTTVFNYRTSAHEGKAEGTLFALYPHQWRSASGIEFQGEFNSVRGKMKLAQGASFRTAVRFPGVLPALPRTGGVDPATLAGYLKEAVASKLPELGDTYADGKRLGKNACLIPIAEQFQLNDVADGLRERVKKRLENWFTAGEGNNAKKRGLFYYDSRWGTLIGYPASYGSDTELNDHHFHYGYFIKAAAEIARHDPAWAADDRWGPMVRLLIRDIACWDRNDARFPFLRNFDPYAGHSWASGHAKFGDGNNNESSSEAMNAWSGLILWGEATGDLAIRDLGIYLYTTEMCGINEYWFDVHGDNFPKSYPASLVTMVWGGKGANATWFSGRPEHVHGINWMPIHGGSLYLGLYPAYVEKNYSALVQENGGNNWKGWADIIWMYRALVDAPDAVKQFESAKDKTKFEDGNSKANTAYWLYSLNELGQVDSEVTADYPLFAVFRKGKTRTYCAYNMTSEPRTVLFSDGFKLMAPAKGFVMAKAGE